MFAPRRLSAAACALVLGLGAAAQAAASSPGAHDAGGTSQSAKKLQILHRPLQRLHRSAETWSRQHPSRAAAASGDYQPPEAIGVSSSTLEAVAACESGGDPTAVSADGTYRGKYQFDYGTWAAVGGSGDPASAPEAEQDMRAAMLYAQTGSSPWPVCG